MMKEKTMNTHKLLNRTAGGIQVAVITTLLLLGTALTAQETDVVRYNDMSPRSGVVPTITIPVTTSYGTYTPYRTPKYKATIGLSEPNPRSDFANIITPAGGFSWERWFSGSERASLQRDRAALKSEAMGSFAQAYNAMEDMPGFVPFITTDAVISGLRVTSEEAYRQAQRDHLASDLQAVLTSLATNLGVAVASEPDSKVREGTNRLLAYIETARLLLNPSATVNPQVSEIVRGEVEKIRSGGTAESSVLPDRRINYEEFVPGGHYRTDQDLERYYQAKSWLGKVELRLGASQTESRMAALLARAVDMLDDRDQARLRRINEIEAFFSGRAANRMTPEEMAGSMRAWYGFQYDGGPSYLADDQSVERLVGYVRKVNPSRELTLTLLPENNSSGTDLLALVKSGAATQNTPHGMVLLEAMRGEEGSGNAGLRELRNRVGNVQAEEWAENIDLLSLYTASILLGEERSAGFPQFMRGTTWRNRLQQSALGSWGAFVTEQGTVQKNGSATRTASGNSSANTTLVGYIEPDPEAWGVIAAQARYIREGLVGNQYDRLINTGVEEKLLDIENAAAQFMRIAVFELQGLSLTPDQKRLVASAPERIAAWETYTDKSLRNGAGLTASGSQNGELSPALGHPVALYVIIPTPEGELLLTRGAVFNYEETAMRNEEWVNRITTGSGPESVPLSAINVVERPLNSVTASLQKDNSRSTTATTYIELESSIVRRASGGVWYTIHAPYLTGADVITTVVDASGRSVFQSFPLPIENGERYDLVPTEDLQSGHYFIRVSTVTGQMLASGRFMIVQ